MSSWNIAESNGEISCSIEETNRIRASLGLRPLDILVSIDTSSSSSSSSSSSKVNSITSFENKSSSETFIDLSASRAQKDAVTDKALKTAKIQREQELLVAKNAPTLGEKLVAMGGAEASSTAEWVRMSRSTNQTNIKTRASGTALVMAKTSSSLNKDVVDEEDEILLIRGGINGKKRRREETSTYDSKDLAGLRIGHSSSLNLTNTIDQEEGADVVLTLKDTEILSKGKGDTKGGRSGDMHLADPDGSDDELVNIQAIDRERLISRLEREKKSRMPIYSSVDELSKKKTNLLSQYDADEDNNLQDKKSLVISSDGGIIDKNAELQQREAVSKALDDKTKTDLESFKPQLPTEKSDFYTETEIASLVAAAAAKKKKKKVLRKSGDDADPAMIGTTVDPHLVNDNIKISDSHKLISDIRKQQGLVDMDGVRKSEDTVTSAIGGSDLGSRSQRRAQAENQAIIDAAAASERGNKAFEAAYEKAAMMTKAKLGHIASSTGVSNVYDASENRPKTSLISAKTLASSTGGWTDATTESGMNNTESNFEEMASTNPVQLALRTHIRAAAEAAHLAQVSNLNKATHQRAYSRLRSIGGGFDTGEGEADDAELQAALSRARRLTVKPEQLLPPLYSLSSSSSSSFSSNVVSSENSRAGVFVESQPTNPSQTVGQEGSLLVFDDVSGFSRKMEAQHILEESEEKSRVQLRNSAAVPEVTLAQPLLKSQNADQYKEEKDVNGDDNDNKDDDDDEDMEIEDDDMVVDEDFGARFDSSGQVETTTTTSSSLSIQGIAGALKLFQNTGAITSKKTVELKGRTKDKRSGDLVVPIAEIGGGTKFSGGGISGKLDEFVIEYKDEHGKKLTTKEAYRQLSYKFHGKMPSKSVLDKRLKKAKREEKISKVGLGETPLQTALLRAQEVKASAFVILEKS